MSNILKNNSAFQNLNLELSRPIPNFTSIEKAIQVTPPAIIALAIEEDVGFTYLLDYFFRHIHPETVRSILQNPMFTHSAMIELFYCQITSYHKAILQKKPPPELFSSYWSNLTKAEYAILFKSLIQRTSDFGINKIVLSKIDLVYLRMMTKSGALNSEKVLQFFKSLGTDLQKFAAKDIHIYDFALDLAVTNSDEEFLKFLDDYTIMFVQLRLVSTIVEEIENEIKKNKGIRLSYMQILQLCANIPLDCLKITLDILEEKKWISSSENKSILEHYSS